MQTIITNAASTYEEVQYHAKLIEELQNAKKELENELERVTKAHKERCELHTMQLVAISTATLANTTGAIDSFTIASEYNTSSLQDVLKAIRREIAHRDQYYKLLVHYDAACKTIKQIADYADTSIWGDSREDAAESMLRVADDALNTLPQFEIPTHLKNVKET